MTISLLRKFFREFDMFSSEATFRTRGEPEVRNTCAGVLSFAILLLFVYLFISQFTQAANWQNIQSIETQSYTFDETRNVSTFMVGVGLEGFNLSNAITLKFARIQMLQIIKNGTKILSSRRLKTQRCTKAHWPQLNDSIDSIYVSFELQKKMCLGLNQSFQIQQPSTGIYKIFKVQINACRRVNITTEALMYEGCVTDAEALYANQLQIKKSKYFTGTIIYLNTAFNPLSQIPTTKYLQTSKVTFTINQGTEAYVELLTYQIETDSSLLPYPQIKIQQGTAVHKVERNNFQIVQYFEHSSCIFMLSSTSVLISRNVGKFDEILSYAGGLFGIIISILSFFMMSFNQYRYELMTAESAFNYNEDGKKIREKDLTYFLYLKYQIYDWVKTLTCYEIKWSDCREIDQTREQAVNQLDISLMFKKIQYFQRFIEHIISEKQKIGLFLTQPPSIQKVRTKRMIAQYYDKVIKGRPAVTVEDLNLETGAFELVEDHFQFYNIENSKIFEEKQDILTLAIQKYNQQRLEIQADDDVHFNEDEQKIEEHISETFFKISESSRKKIQRKIPIKILKRLLKIRVDKAPTSISSINLSI